MSCVINVHTKDTILEIPTCKTYVPRTQFVFFIRVRLQKGQKNIYVMGLNEIDWYKIDAIHTWKAFKQMRVASIFPQVAPQATVPLYLV